MSAVRALLFAGGVVLLGFLVSRVGIDTLTATLGRLTWWELVLICLPYALIMAVDTLGWRFAFTGQPPPYLRLLAARTAGEALNVVTAVGSVGGEAVKVWLLRGATSYEESVPSVVIAKTTATIAQALFLLVGLVLALATPWLDGQIVTAMIALLVVETLAVAGFLLSQLGGVVGRAGRVLAWTGLVKETGAAERLDTTLRRFYREQWGRFALSVGFHLAGWLLGVLEALVMLHVLQVHAWVTTAAVIESLGSGVRFVSFLVPGNLGVLEGANTGVFALLGLGAGTGLAFTLVRRARQTAWIALGLVVLLVAGAVAMPVRAARPRAPR
ncbi:MAG: flippase-like domain-containing protein [Candidatus Rokuibacteriota bacterium]